jgi:hypothetical protein
MRMLKRWAGIAAPCVLLLATPALANAQAPRVHVRFQALEFETGSNAKMAAYGLLTGAAGFLVGGLVGAALSGDRADEDSWVENLTGAVVGGTVGESLMLPIGVHIANDRRGDLLWSMPASLAIGTVGGVLARNFNSKSKAWPILVLTPIAQIAASIAIERNTGN